MSFIYEIACWYHNDEKLEVQRSMIDDGHDIFIEINPCPECIKEAVNKEREKHDSPS